MRSKPGVAPVWVALAAFLVATASSQIVSNTTLAVGTVSFIFTSNVSTILKFDLPSDPNHLPKTSPCFITFVTDASMLYVTGAIGAPPGLDAPYTAVRRSPNDWEMWIPSQPLTSGEPLVMYLAVLSSPTTQPTFINPESPTMLDLSTNTSQSLVVQAGVGANQKRWFGVEEGTAMLMPAFSAELCDFPIGLSLTTQFFLTVYASDSDYVQLFGPAYCTPHAYLALTETQFYSRRVSICPARLQLQHTPNQTFYFSVFAYQDPGLSPAGVYTYAGVRVLFQGQSILPFSSHLGSIHVGDDFYLSLMDASLQRGRFPSNYTAWVTDTSNFTDVQISQAGTWSLLNQACFLTGLDSAISHPYKSASVHADNEGIITVADGTTSIRLRDWKKDRQDYRSLTVVASTDALGVLLAYDAIVPSRAHQFSSGPASLLGVTLPGIIAIAVLAALLLTSVAINAGVVYTIIRNDRNPRLSSYEPLH